MLYFSSLVNGPRSRGPAGSEREGGEAVAGRCITRLFVPARRAQHQEHRRHDIERGTAPSRLQQAFHGRTSRDEGRGREREIVPGYRPQLPRERSHREMLVRQIARAGQEEPLAVATPSAQRLQLAGLDPLGDDRRADLPGERDKPAARACCERSVSIAAISVMSSLMKSGASRRMWRRLAKPAPASSIASRTPRARGGASACVERVVVLDRRVLGHLDHDPRSGRPSRAASERGRDRVPERRSPTGTCRPAGAAELLSAFRTAASSSSS